MAKIYCKSSYLLRKDTSENWQNKNPILRKGEQGLETDTGIMKIGDGTTEYNSLSDNNIYLPKSHNKNIDQTYNPDSTNAQSGKAVAEAVAIEQKRADNTFANALKGTKSDTAMLLDDVSPVTHEMGVKVKNKNLLNYEYFGLSQTKNGISFTNNRDGTVTASGTATANTFYYLVDNIEFLGYYTLSGCPSGGSTTTYLMGFGGSNFTDIGSGTTRNFPNKQKVNVFIKIFKGVTVENLVFKPQIELGTTATDYTPYVPDLTAVKVSRCGKNLLDIQNPLSTAKDPIITYNSITATKDLTNATYQVFLVAGDYTISFIKSSFASLTITDSSGNVIYNVGSLSNVNYTFSLLSNDTLKFKIGFGRFVESGITSITVSNVQLELSSTATYYEPYITPTDYTPTADGTVNGVTSLYPNTTLMTDTDGVLIDCEYNRDINKAFAELQQAIISLGGNV